MTLANWTRNLYLQPHFIYRLLALIANRNGMSQLSMWSVKSSHAAETPAEKPTDAESAIRNDGSIKCLQCPFFFKICEATLCAALARCPNGCARIPESKAVASSVTMKRRSLRF